MPLSTHESLTTQYHLFLEISRESIEEKAFLVLLVLELSNSRSRINPTPISLPLFTVAEPYHHSERNKWEICPINGPSKVSIGLTSIIFNYKIPSDDNGSLFPQVLADVQPTTEFVQASINLFTTEDYLKGQILLYLKLVEKLSLKEASIKLSEF